MADPEPTWRSFVRRHFMRITIVTVLLVSSGVIIPVIVTYLREQRIGREIEALDGFVTFQSCAPRFIPASAQERLPVFARITSINLAGNVPTKVFADLGRLTHLENLSIGDANFADSDLHSLTAIHSLKGLDLMHWEPDNSRVTNATMEHVKDLTGLESLNLRLTRVTDDGLKQLAGMTNLIQLDLQDTHVTNMGLELLSNMTKLQDLALDNTPVTDDGMRSLLVFKNLKRLTLRGKGITDVGVEQIAKIKSLERLRLEHTGISDAGVAYLVSLPNLNNLDLTGARITVAALPHLRAMPKLHKLCLCDASLRSPELLRRELPGLRISLEK